MYHRREGLQGLAPGAAQGRRLAAAVALICAARAAAADPVPPAVARPIDATAGWQVALTGYLQADAIAWSQASVDELDPSTGQPLNEQRVLIRRGRLIVLAHRDALSASMEFDGDTQAGATARLIGAQLTWTYPTLDPAVDGPPLAAISAGLLQIPFGVEVPTSARDKPFLEPPAMSRALFPGAYDAGVMVRGGYGQARWSIAAMNGAPVGDAQWKGKDPAASYDLVGRLGAEVTGPAKLRVEAGVSALAGSGLHAGTAPTKDGLQWVDENQNGRVDPTELQIIPGSPGTPSQKFHRDALGADLTVRWCACGLGDGVAFAELAIATNLDRGLVYSDPVSASRDLRQLGLAIGVVQDLGPYLQLGVRYDRYDADRDAQDREGVALVNPHKLFSTFAVLASVRWAGARLAAEYDRERNPFGRRDSGAPISLAADRLTVRAQVGF